MTEQLNRIAPTFNWRAHIQANYGALMAHPLTRRILDSILSNDHFAVNCWGPRGSGKSTFQRQLSYKIYGNWDLVYMFRVQTKKELMEAIEYVPLDKRFWVDYHGIPLKRVPLLDIDDKGTIFPSSVGNTKEMSEWHKWWQSLRTQVAVIIGSSPVMTDVRKRLRIGADAEILCGRKLYPNGRKKFEAQYREFIYHSNWKDPEGLYVSKKHVCDIPWSQLPKDILHREMGRRSQLSEILRGNIGQSPEAHAQALVFDSEDGLMEYEKELIQIAYETFGKASVLGTTDIAKAYNTRFGIGNRGPGWLGLRLRQLSEKGVLRYSGSGHGLVEKTELGKQVNHLLKTQNKSNESREGNS